MIAGGRRKRYAGFALVVGTGGGLFLTHVAHAVGEDESVVTFLLGILLPMLSAVAVVGGGVVLWRRDTDGGEFLRVGAWSTVGTVVLAIGGVLVIVYQQQYGVMMDEQPFVVINSASAGALVGFVVGVYDIRQRRARARADQVNRQLTVLNRILRHDIRNRANIIRGNADLLGGESADTAERADRIRQNATSLVDLGEQAKQIERILEEGRRGQQVVDVASVADACCERVRREYPDAVVECDVDPGQHVVAHRSIASAVGNVLENAVVHNGRTTPHVTVESRTVSDAGTDYVELRIADDGPGIPDSEVETLERGYETDLEHSSGLGLWIVSWIVENADGDVGFEENDPAGTVVCLRMKRASRGQASPPATGAADTTTS